MQRLFNNKSFFVLLFVVLGLTACEKEEYTLPEPVAGLSNDVIKRTLGPNIAGLPINFAYAMALPKAQGKLVSAQVQATIAGGTGTFLEHNSYFTNTSGQDVPVVIGTPSVNKDNLTTVTFNVDTNAATLRYNYVVPAEAKGKTVNFTFSANSSDGKTATYNMGPYTISNMDIKRTMPVNNANARFISIADMAVYDNTTVVGNEGKIDLVYIYRAAPTSFTHALVSPAADPQYLPGVTLPAGVNRNTKVRKVFNLQDRNLAQLQNGIYIDDKDFQDLDLGTAPNYALGLRAEAGTWVETADGKYRAYVYLNSVNSNGSGVISMLRYTL